MLNSFFPLISKLDFLQLNRPNQQQSYKINKQFQSLKSSRVRPYHDHK